MSVVGSDASSLILFTNIGRLDILEQLFGEVRITSAVETEYSLELPPFISVQDPSDSGRHEALRVFLDAGEASAIALAAEIPDSKIIIDEKKGRRVAIAMGLDVTGRVGVLLNAGRLNLLEIDESFVERLDACGCRLTPKLKSLLLGRD